jgi:hypothetical protein
MMLDSCREAALATGRVDARELRLTPSDLACRLV